MEPMGRATRPRRSFTKEFKAEVVERVRQPGNTAASVARDLDLSEMAVRVQVKQATSTTGLVKGLAATGSTCRANGSLGSCASGG